MCSLSTSAERASVSARMPPHQPVPITATSTCSTACSLGFLMAIKHSGRCTSNALADPEHACGELRIDFGKLRRDHRAQEPQRFGGGGRRLGHVVRAAE